MQGQGRWSGCEEGGGTRDHRRQVRGEEGRRQGEDDSPKGRCRGSRRGHGGREEAREEARAGYFSLTVGQIDPLEAPERIRKGMGQYPVPVVILARLAASTQDHGRGIGIGLLQDAIRRTMLIADQAGIRAMLTRPIDDDASRFYTRFGFIASPLREQQLLLLLKDARRWVR